MYFISWRGGSSSKENGQCESPKRKRDMLLKAGGTDRPRWLEQREKVNGCMDAGRAAETTGQPVLERGNVKSNEEP